MASAGQAQAHSSQPMHFSRPSGQRLSWWRPWKRGAVGCFSNGYCSVTTFLNMVRKVTPNPATGSQSCSLRVLPSWALLTRGPRGSAGSASDFVGSCQRVLLDGRDRAAGVEPQRGGGAADGASGRHRRHREAALVALRNRLVLVPLVAGLVAEEEHQQEQHNRDPEPDQEVLAVHTAVQRDGADRRDRDDPEQREGDQPLPAERHELVVAHPRQRPAQPDEDEDEEEHLAHEPQEGPVAGVRARPDLVDPERRVPAAQEQRGGQRRDGRHVDVLGQEEQRELQAGVLGVEATDELTLRLGQVEGRSVGLPHHRDRVDHERRCQDQPEPPGVLRSNDLAGRHRPGVEEHGHQSQAHRDLIGDHLGARAQTSEQGVRRAAGPTTQHDAVDADRGDRHHEQHRDRHVRQLERRSDVAEGDRHLRPERDHRERHERRDHRDHRGEQEDRLVGSRRDDVFLERELHAVGEALEQTERPVHVRPDAVLHPRHDTTLEPDVEQRQHHQDHEDQHGLQQHQPPGVQTELLQTGSAGTRWDDEHDCCAHWSAPFTRTPLPGEARSARTPLPVEFAGTQTVSGARSAHGSVGRVIEPRSPVSVTSSPSAAYASGETRQTGVRAVARRCFSPSCIDPLSSISFQVASASEPSSVAAAADASGRLARSPSHGPISVIARWASAVVRNPSGRPSSSAIPASTRASGRALGLVNTASKGRVRPSQFTNIPALSVTAATGKTTSAAAVTSVSRSSRATTNRAAPRAARNAAGSEVSSGSTPPTTRPARSPEVRAATMASPSRPSPSGRLSMPQAVAASTRAAASDSGRPPGSRFGRQPVSTAPRSLARRGTQASLAPLVRARRATAVSAPGTVAIRSPTRITPALSSSTSPSWARPATTSASAPGRAAISVPPSLRRPLVDSAATDQTRVRCWRWALRSRRKIVPASSSGSSPTRRTELALSRSAYVAPWRRTTSEARNAASSAEWGRARKSMSFVPSATRAKVL